MKQRGSVASRLALTAFGAGLTAASWATAARAAPANTAAQVDSSEPAEPTEPPEPTEPSEPTVAPEVATPAPTAPATTAQPAAAAEASRQTSMAPPSTVALAPGVRLPPKSDLSPQHMAVELRFGPYMPRVDDGVESPVFEDFFGDDNRYQVGFEVDYQLWRAPYLGTLGVGFGFGYTSMTGPNLPSGEEGTGGQPISQRSTLSIMPMYAVGVLRVDVLSREFSVPIVPYGKLGLGYALWWVNDGISTARTDDGTIGKDSSAGVQTALGGMLLLDPIDPVSARAMDAELGINNSYLFFEWAWSNFEGRQMNVGASTWVTGIAVEL